MLKGFKNFSNENLVDILSQNKHKLFLIKFKENEKSPNSYYLSRHILGIGNREKVFSKEEGKKIDVLIKNKMLVPIYDEFKNKNSSCQAYHS